MRALLLVTAMSAALVAAPPAAAEVSANATVCFLAWGSIDNGTTGDAVWLDRSWDGGATWPDGSSLGRVATPAGAMATRTTMFATRDPRSRPSSWWNSAATLTTLIDHGDPAYDWVTARTFDQNKGVFPAGVRGTDAIEGNFLSRAIDDSAWWGLAWVAACDRTGQRRYLAMAPTIANYVHQYWDTGTCGGGVWWNRERTYKNAVTSGVYLRLVAAVSLRAPSDTVWSQRTRADAALTGLTRDGVLTESCDIGQHSCDDNQKQFKGIFSRYLADLASVTGSAHYQGSPNQLDWRTQASGLGALVAA